MGVGYLTGQGGGGSNINSIQSGTHVFSGTSYQNDITISGVDVSKSIIKIAVTRNSATGSDAYVMVAAEIINENTVRFSCSDYSASFYPIINWVVVEFNGVKSKQTGSLSMTTATHNVSISSVVINKTIAFISSKSYSGTGGTLSQMLCREKIVDSTTLELKSAPVSASYLPIVYWQVIEFK